MAERRSIGSWLAGAPAAGSESGYPGEELGLPQTGPRSVAGLGRRYLALLADWLICLVVAFAVFRSPRWSATSDWTLLVFAVQAWLLTATTGVTLGKRLLGIRVARLDGRPVGFGWALLRTLLLLALIPPVVTDGDLRGLHDRAANTVVVRI